MEQINQMKGLKGYSDPKHEAAMLDRLRQYESSRERHYDEEARMITQALQQAITETVQRIASVIINERREEIEAACNFGELRDVLAAEPARQFMASRLMGTATPFDKPIHLTGATGISGISQGPLQSPPITQHAKGTP